MFEKSQKLIFRKMICFSKVINLNDFDMIRAVFPFKVDPLND